MPETMDLFFFDCLNWSSAHLDSARRKIDGTKKYAIK